MDIERLIRRLGLIPMARGGYCFPNPNFYQRNAPTDGGANTYGTWSQISSPTGGATAQPTGPYLMTAVGVDVDSSSTNSYFWTFQIGRGPNSGAVTVIGTFEWRNPNGAVRNGSENPIYMVPPILFLGGEIAWIRVQSDKGGGTMYCWQTYATLPYDPD